MRSVSLFEFLEKHDEYGFIAGVYDIIPARGEYLASRFGLKDAVTYGSVDELRGR